MSEVFMSNLKRCCGFFILISVMVLSAFSAFALPVPDKHIEYTKDRPMAEVDANKALIYVVRPTFVGKAVKTYFICDDEFKGINKGQTYFYFYIEPGKHVFWSKAENVDALELEVKAGETYYIKQGIQMGMLKARVKLFVLSTDEGQMAMEKCKKHIRYTEKGNEKGNEIAIKYIENTKKDLARREKKK